MQYMKAAFTALKTANNPTPILIFGRSFELFVRLNTSSIIYKGNTYIEFVDEQIEYRI
jgi:hypothetical protein